MRSRRRRDGWNSLLEDLAALQVTWEGKMANLIQVGRGLRAHGVVFGIETGRRAIAESSPVHLNALLIGWEKIAKIKAKGPAAESIRGIDFGIRLVVRRVRRYLNRLAPAKPPRSAHGGKASPGQKHGPRSQA